uniref:Glucosidase II beta subunit-like protein n=3 Tax=Toxoplasma gondii TaxID=5811 RepID=A0A2T6IUQ2_TOXGO|nr:glucosidase II beta subunit-like protein [Toxoplasma gondii TgCATBr9]
MTNSSLPSTLRLPRREPGVAWGRSSLSRLLLLSLYLGFFCSRETESAAPALSMSEGPSRSAAVSSHTEAEQQKGKEPLGGTSETLASSTSSAPPSSPRLPDAAAATARQTQSAKLSPGVETFENSGEGEKTQGARKGRQKGRMQREEPEHVKRARHGGTETPNTPQTAGAKAVEREEEAGGRGRKGIDAEEAYALPKGVNPRFSAAYTPQFSSDSSSFLYPSEQLRRHGAGTAFFKCPSSGLLIPWEMLNDNFCDCRDDGFDEPGTDACSGVAPVHTAAAERLRAALHTFLHSRGGEASASGATQKAEATLEKEQAASAQNVCGPAGGCDHKVFGKLKGAAGFFCSSGREGEGDWGKPRVISPMKVHDGVCDCCDGADEAPDVSLLRVSAVAFRPFSPEFPFRETPKLSACPNRCAEEKAEWEAEVKAKLRRLAVARAQTAAQTEQMRRVVQQRASEKAQLEAEVSRLQRALDCSWMTREARQRGAQRPDPAGSLHHNAALHRAVKREILAAHKGAVGQAQKAEEVAAEAEEEQLHLWCQKVVQDVLGHGGEGGEGEDTSRDEAGIEAPDEELSAMVGAQLSGPPTAFSRPDKVALFPPPRLQYELHAEGREPAKAGQAEDGGPDARVQSPEERRAAAVAAKAEASRRAALEAYLEQQSRGAGPDEDEAPSTRGGGWTHVWDGVKQLAQQGARALQRGLAWVGVGPTPQKKSLGALQRSLEELKQKKAKLEKQMKNLEGVNAILAPLYSVCLFTSDSRRRFDFQICLFDRVRQFFHRSHRAREALLAYQNATHVDGETPKDASQFTGGLPGEPMFALGTFRSLEVVKCPKGNAAATGKLLGRGTREKLRAWTEQSKDVAIPTDPTTGFAFRLEDESEEEDDLFPQGGDPEFCFSMFFADGDACPNDSRRETEILIHCGPELFVVQVQEPAMCRYSILLETPLLCPREQLLQLEKERFAVYHDEL